MIVFHLCYLCIGWITPIFNNLFNFVGCENLFIIDERILWPYCEDIRIIIMNIVNVKK